MIPVAEAQARILAGVRPVGIEDLSVAQAHGRVLARPAIARRTQPPVAVSAMDGWAVRGADVTIAPVTLTEIGRVPAGSHFAGTVGPGQAARIFTGAALPDGADTVVIQEDIDAEGSLIRVREATATGRWVRAAGLDFAAGDALIQPARRLTARDLALAAAMDLPWLTVRRRPRIALLATGDELVRPGEARGPTHVVSSNLIGLAGLVRAAGGEPIDLGIAPDRAEDLAALGREARGADLLVTSGGASVGEHDLVHSALGTIGLELDFWKIAMRPGKPLMYGRIGEMPMLGLPGNPVSTLVCGLLFLVPLVETLAGLPPTPPPTVRASLGMDLRENDQRQDYLRARIEERDGELVASPLARQDSSMSALLALADGLIVRAPGAAAARTGDPVEVIRFDRSCLPI